MVLNFLDDLNTAQKQAVTHTQGNLLVLAGAGSGKTRVLVYRIAWLLSQGVDMHNILAVTFTNKAATEMRNRLEEILKKPLTSMWVGTFHGLANRLLRLHWQAAGLEQNFQIIDADDQTRLLKGIHKTFNLDQERWPVKRSQLFINSNKEQGLRADRVTPQNYADDTLIKIYWTYEDLCKRSNSVDFAELLLRSYELWQNDQQVREHYQERFRHLLVDEFQDTNAIQYAWINRLFGKDAALTVVGDDDQSIYSWRGADSNNMRRLTKDYANLSTIRLEQNYRSTSTILAAANAVIANNNNRLGKKLWAQNSGGEPITLYRAFNEMDEARYMAGKIQTWFNHSRNLNEVAVLYRSNAQSRVIEEQLLRTNIPYRVYGGMRFFERAEIKDALAYLRLLVNRHDDAAFARVVNLPARGIGDSTLLLLHDYAKSHNCSLWQSGQDMVATNQLPGRAGSALTGFMRLIDDGAQEVTKIDLPDLVFLLIEISGLGEYYDVKSKKGGDKQSRTENLDELVSAAKQFATTQPGEDRQLVLHNFLSHVALEAGERVDRNNSNECVNLMTLHAAKGLEFPLVFICGMEEGLFPHVMSLKNQDDAEEERRLCYVGMTRAMGKLYLLSASSRRLRGKSSHRQPSRFLQEVPSKLIVDDTIVNSVKPALAVSTPSVPSSVTRNTCKFYLGQKVTHQKFGPGIIIHIEGDGESMYITVRFRRFGTKTLMPEYLLSHHRSA